MVESIWNGYKRVDFLFEGRECILVFPEHAVDGKNWLLKTEYFDDFPSFEIEMVSRGWHLAYIKNVTRWCIDEDLDLKERFARFLHSEYSLSEKCVPVGMSCGGLIACKFAAKYPHCVAALYLDAPVMNLLSCPARVGRGESGTLNEFITATGITLSKLIFFKRLVKIK